MSLRAQVHSFIQLSIYPFIKMNLIHWLASIHSTVHLSICNYSMYIALLWPSPLVLLHHCCPSAHLSGCPSTHSSIHPIIRLCVLFTVSPRFIKILSYLCTMIMTFPVIFALNSFSSCVTVFFLIA